MSVCSQDWPDHYPSLVFGRCPFWNKEYGKCKVGQKSDSCPHAPALRAAVENPELVLVPVPKKLIGVFQAILDGNISCRLYNGDDVHADHLYEIAIPEKYWEDVDL